LCLKLIYVNIAEVLIDCFSMFLLRIHCYVLACYARVANTVRVSGKISLEAIAKLQCALGMCTQ